MITKSSFLSRFSFSRKKEVKEEISLNETETVETKPKKKSLFSNFTIFPKKKEIKVISEFPTEGKKKSFFSLSFGKKAKVEKAEDKSNINLENNSNNDTLNNISTPKKSWLKSEVAKSNSDATNYLRKYVASKEDLIGVEISPCLLYTSPSPRD